MTAAPERPCRVLMATQSSHLWSSNHPIYMQMLDDPRFEVMVVAIPSRQPGFSTEFSFDPGLYEGLEKRDVAFLDGFDGATGRLVEPGDLEPDFAFLQTPYDEQRPDSYGLAALNRYCRTLYVPYGMLLFGGAVQDLVHPRGFFNQLWRAFAENAYIQSVMAANTGLPPDRLPVTGYVRHDYYLGPRYLGDHDHRWNRPRRDGAKRVIWNPRWSVHAGDSTFLEHFDALLAFARQEPKVDLVLRPHPLLLENLRRVDAGQHTRIMRSLEEGEAAGVLKVDFEGDYFELFESSDFFISDGSTLIADYFPTCKPVVLTTSLDELNVLGRTLGAGCYAAPSTAVLIERLDMLLEDRDPHREVRQDLCRMLFQNLYTGERASAQVTRHLLSAFHGGQTP